MASTNVYAERSATSWGSVLGGWVATLGASVIFAPLVAGLMAALVGGTGSRTDGDVTLGVPVIVGLFLSYIVGGYVAGRMAGYRTSWHGLMTAFFSLFVLLVLALLGWAAGNGYLRSVGIAADFTVAQSVGGLDRYGYGTALTFGAILGFLAAIFGGWLGGLLAPTYPPATLVVPRTTSVVEPAPVREQAPREATEDRTRPLQPSYARKGGQPAEEATRPARVKPEERRPPDEG